MRNLKKCCVKFIRFMQVIFLRMKKFVKKNEKTQKCFMKKVYEMKK